MISSLSLRQDLINALNYIGFKNIEPIVTVSDREIRLVFDLKFEHLLSCDSDVLKSIGVSGEAHFEIMVPRDPMKEDEKQERMDHWTVMVPDWGNSLPDRSGYECGVSHYVFKCGFRKALYFIFDDLEIFEEAAYDYLVKAGFSIYFPPKETIMRDYREPYIVFKRNGFIEGEEPVKFIQTVEFSFTDETDKSIYGEIIVKFIVEYPNFVPPTDNIASKFLTKYPGMDFCGRCLQEPNFLENVELITSDK